MHGLRSANIHDREAKTENESESPSGTTRLSVLLFCDTLTFLSVAPPSVSLLVQELTVFYDLNYS